MAINISVRALCVPVRHDLDGGSHRGQHTRWLPSLSALQAELLLNDDGLGGVQRRIAEAIPRWTARRLARASGSSVSWMAPATSATDARWPDCRARRSWLQQATFELHPAVREQVGLGPAVKQLTDLYRSAFGYQVLPPILVQYVVGSTPSFPVWFRELLSNVVQHSRLPPPDSSGSPTKKYVLDVAD